LHTLENLRCDDSALVRILFTDNMVDGLALANITHDDVIAMLPGKIGAARKLIVLLERLKVSAAC